MNFSLENIIMVTTHNRHHWQIILGANGGRPNHCASAGRWKSQKTKGYWAQTNRHSNIVIQQNKANKHFNCIGWVNHLGCWIKPFIYFLFIRWLNQLGSWALHSSWWKLQELAKIGFLAPCSLFFEFWDFDKILKINTHMKLHHKNASAKL